MLLRALGGNQTDTEYIPSTERRPIAGLIRTETARSILHRFHGGVDHSPMSCLVEREMNTPLHLREASGNVTLLHLYSGRNETEELR